MRLRLVFDSSFLLEDLNPDSGKWIRFRGYAEVLDLVVVVPEVVVSECAAHLIETVERNLSEIGKNLKRLAQLPDYVDESKKFSSLLLCARANKSLDDSISKFKEQLESLTGCNTEIVPFPNVAHSTILDRSLRRRN